jgi:hypothetical protein
MKRNTSAKGVFTMPGNKKLKETLLDENEVELNISDAQFNGLVFLIILLGVFDEVPPQYVPYAELIRCAMMNDY